MVWILCYKAAVGLPSRMPSRFLTWIDARQGRDGDTTGNADDTGEWRIEWAGPRIPLETWKRLAPTSFYNVHGGLCEDHGLHPLRCTILLFRSRQSGCRIGQLPWREKISRAAFSRKLPVFSLASEVRNAPGGIGKNISWRLTGDRRLSWLVWIIFLRRSLRHTNA